MGCLEQEAAFSHAHFARKYRSLRAPRCEGIARGDSIAACERRDGTGSRPMLSFSDYIEATRRLRMGKAPGRDHVPAELRTSVPSPILVGLWTTWSIGAVSASVSLFKQDGRLLWTAVCIALVQIGFIAGHQPVDATEALRTLLRKCYKWAASALPASTSRCRALV